MDAYLNDSISADWDMDMYQQIEDLGAQYLQ